MMTDVNTSLADALCQRINCRNIGAWLQQLAIRLKIPTKALLPVPVAIRHDIDLPEHGCRLILTHPHAGYVEDADINRWIITEAHFIPTTQANTDHICTLPFNLDAENDTPQTVQSKLDGDSVGLFTSSLKQGDRRQSYFLDDALVVEIMWRPELFGIEQVSVVRMGSELLEPLHTL